MNWQDTVMPIEERVKFGVWNGREKQAQAQAEISFKAGEQQGIKLVVEDDKIVSQHILQSRDGDWSIESKWLKQWFFNRQAFLKEIR